MSRPLGTAAKGFAITMLAYGFGALDIAIAPREMERAATSNMALAAEILFFGIATVFFARYRKDILSRVRRVPWIVALGLLAICSTAWSQDPSLTLRRSIVFAGTILFGIFFGTCFKIEEQIRMLAIMSLAVLLASALVAVALPQYGIDIDDHPGCWRGLYAQRNGLARMAVLAFLVFSLWRPQRRIARFAAECLAITTLVMTRSATAIVVVVAIVALLQIFRLSRLRLPALVAITCALAIAVGLGAFVLIDHVTWLVGLLGRDVTLTGRTALWSEVIAAIRQHALLGYGFDAFWTVPAGAAGSIMDHFFWASHSHNGLLDLWLALGMVGVAVFAIGFGIVLRSALKAYMCGNSTDTAWPLAYLSFMCLYNLTESATLVPKSAFLMLYAAIAAVVSVERKRSLAVTLASPPDYLKSSRPLALRNGNTELEHYNHLL